jgi:hypothetical protein
MRGEIEKSQVVKEDTVLPACSAPGNPLPVTFMFLWRLLKGIVRLLEKCVQFISPVSVE